MKSYEVTLSSPGGALKYDVDAACRADAIAAARRWLQADVGGRNARKYRHIEIEEMERDENG